MDIRAFSAAGTGRRWLLRSLFVIVITALPALLWAGGEALQEESKAGQREAKISPYMAKYEVHFGGVKVGEMWQQFGVDADGVYTLKTEAYTTGVTSWFTADKIIELSSWRHQDGFAVPISYSYRYRGNSKPVTEQLDFDWQTQQVVSLRGGKSQVIAIEPGTLEKHMLQIVLRQDLLQRDHLSNYVVADRNKLHAYHFELLGEESIELDGFGTIPTVKVKRDDTLFWVAKQFDYLPVRIEKDGGGISASTTLLKYRPG